ncbi:MFS transporter [Actinokineospora sp.]|uniref:MFS transporter n=1 Tax=Actinokineospora sp. TaxID=1872133 RepID=UPI0040383B31
MVSAVPRTTERAPAATLVIVCLALFMALFDSTAISLMLPAIRADLDADIAGLVWIADGYVLIFAALLLTSGSLGDRLGRARMFLAGMAVFTAGSAVCAVAPNLPVLVGGRIVQGLGAALVTPQTLAILTQTFPAARDRARAFGIWSGVSGLALILGPILGGALVDAWGWRSVFLVNLPIGVLTLILGARVLGGWGSPARFRGAVDLPGQLLTVLWLSTLTFGLIEGTRLGWTAAPVLGLFAVSVVAFVVLVAVERRVSNPMLHLELWRSRTFTASTLVIALVAFGMYASFFLLSLFLQQVQGLSPTTAGVRFLPAMVAVVIAAPLAGLIAGRFGSRPPIVAGGVLMGVSLLLLGGISADAAYSSWWYLLVVFGVGIGLTIPPVNSALLGSVPVERAGLASATGETGQQIGALVGIAVLGALVAEGFGRVVSGELSGPAARELANRMFAESGGEVGGLVGRGITEGVHLGLTGAGVAALIAAGVGLLIRESRSAG